MMPVFKKVMGTNNPVNNMKGKKEIFPQITNFTALSLGNIYLICVFKKQLEKLSNNSMKNKIAFLRLPPLLLFFL